MLRDGGGGNGVRRRNNGAEDKPGGEGKIGNDPMRDVRDRYGGGENEADGEEENRAQFPPGNRATRY